MTDLSKIKTIDEAKNAEYGGKKLTRNEDKNIFDNDLLKTNGSVDSTKLREVAQLLEKALKAKEETGENSSLLAELNTAKSSNTIGYQVAKSQVDEGITKLESFSSGEKYKTKTKSEWEAEKRSAAACSLLVENRDPSEC